MGDVALGIVESWYLDLSIKLLYSHLRSCHYKCPLLFLVSASDFPFEGKWHDISTVWGSSSVTLGILLDFPKVGICHNKWISEAAA